MQGCLEIVGGVLIILGLFTRPVAFILSGNMAVAYFMAHFPRNFFPALNGGDAAILYLLRLPVFGRGRRWRLECGREAGGVRSFQPLPFWQASPYQRRRQVGWPAITEERNMAQIKRHASAKWQGSGKDGSGSLTTQSATLKDTPYGFNSRFGDGKGTNPEELIAAAHAGCFSMATAFQLSGAGIRRRAWTATPT